MPVTQILDLSNLTASDGFIVQGDADGDQAGVSVSNAGDINGDGIDDFIVGAWRADNLGPYAGEAYVIFGKAGVTRANIDLSNLAASDGFVIHGGGFTGYSVSNAGDINGDGFDDLIVGAYDGNPAVIFGKAGATRADIDLFNLAPADGFRVIQEYSFHRIGASVTGIGDINADGIDDFALGGRGAGANFSFTGTPFVIFGKAGATRADITLATLPASDGFVIVNDGQNEFAGWSISNAGDVNGDGIDDLIFGGPRNDDIATDAGEAYVIFGKVGATRANIDLATLASGDGFRIQGATVYSQAGWSVSNAGDINGDTIDDLVIGSVDSDAYIIFGKSGATRANIDLGNIAASDGFTFFGRNGSGIAIVSSAGDIDGDGIDDLIVGTRYGGAGGNPGGEVYVIYGKAGATRSNIDAANFSFSDGFIIYGDTAGDQAGTSVSAAGDVNNDGIDDLLVGAWRGDNGGTDAGEAYVIYGSSHRNIGTIIGTAGVDTINGTAGDDVINALADNDVLIGGLGDDKLSGGAGNDIYVVDSLGDQVIESSGEGIDSVETAMNGYVLPANVENLEFTGTVNFEGTGNGEANTIVGGSLDDVLHGEAGNDVLAGEAGSDTLNGGDGDDRLIGGTGIDTINGNGGNDVLVVDNASDAANGGDGIDTVQVVTAGLTYVIARDIENVSNLSGGDLTAFLNGSANTYGGSIGVDTVSAGNGNDILYGRAGNDVLNGQLADDKLFGEAGDDLLDGGDGSDLIYGGADNDVLTGGTGTDTLYGEAGNDRLNGSAGIDQLFGGAGGDRFLFAEGDSGATIATADRIRDFSQSQGDRIDVRQIDAITGGSDDAFTFIGSGAFTNVAGQLRAVVSSGQTLLSGDVDGDGVADFLIRIDGVHALTTADFTL